MGTANIAFGYMSARYSRDAAPVFAQSGAAENLTTTNVSATPSVGAAPGDDGGGRDLVARIMLSEEGYVRIGAVAAVGTGLRCIADTEYIFAATPGQTVSIIDTA